ncbi:MAG: hypothetical protein WCV63_06865 [Negativicutes bacterium]|jgi:hypothetical protein
MNKNSVNARKLFVLKIITLAVMVVFVFASMSLGFCKGGGGGRGGGGRSIGSVKSAPKATATAVKSSSTNKAASSTSFGSRIKSWFSQRASSGAAKTYSTPASATNNSYFSNGRYNGWTGIFWGYMLGRALIPHSTQVSAAEAGTTSDGKYELAGEKQYTWDEPSVGDNIIAYGVLVLVVVLVFLIGMLIYKRIKKMLGRKNLTA